MRFLKKQGFEIVASFEDSKTVCSSLKAAGVEEVRQVPHVVEVLPHERDAGYIGAPKPPPKAQQSKFSEGSDWWKKGSGSLIDRHRQRYDNYDYDSDLSHSREVDDYFADQGEFARTQSRFDETLSNYDPYDPNFDPDAVIEMSEVLGDPDAPPMRLHEVLDTDGFFLSDTTPRRRRAARGA